LTKKVYNFGSETDLGGGILSTFVFLLAVTVQVTHWYYSSGERPMKILTTPA